MILGLIPARLKSKRLKDKLLLKLKKMPLIIHTLKHASRSKKLTKLLVCTDSKKIFDIVKKNNGYPIITSSKYSNGTERIADVAKKYKTKLVVDIQGDEIFIDPKLIDKLIQFHLKNLKYDIIVPCTKTENYKDKSIVKFVFNKKFEVVNMTRKDLYCDSDTQFLYKQVDVISFKPEKLKLFARLKKTTNEKKNNIELLRAIDNGLKIKTFIVNTDSFSINTKIDYIKAKKYLNSNDGKKKFKNIS
jgi:3-deoxy-manno-octulosonate cytidylyltransferase (CMP-KDO synthetase)